MTDPTELTRPASQWFADALKAHVAEHPDQIADIEAMIASGRARGSVLVELSDPPEIKCLWQIDKQLVCFHRTPLRDAPAPAQLN